MEHQYPGAISGDEHMLAELMLPDQAHVRNQDWTIFFLHKDTSAEDNGDNLDQENDKKRRRGRKDGENQDDGPEGSEDEDDEEEEEGDDDDDDADEEPAGSESESETDQDDDDEMDRLEGPPLVYVLNLVNMKQDLSVKRYSSALDPSRWSFFPAEAIFLEER